MQSLHQSSSLQMKQPPTMADVKSLPPPFFIMGCGRSGTTLLGQILDNHSRIAVFYETHYYALFRPNLHLRGDLRHPANLRQLMSDFQELIRIKGVNPPTIEEFHQALDAPSFEGVFTAFLRLYALRQGKVRGGDKTPVHCHFLPEIIDRLPDSPVIFLMRDPRDTILSMRRAFGRSLEHGITRWNRAFTAYSQASDRVHLVRYEELVRNPSEVVQAACRFLGESYEPTMLRFFETVPDHVRGLHCHAKLLSPIDAASVGSFKQMSSDEIAQIEAACREGMEAMGYPLSCANRAAPKRAVNSLGSSDWRHERRSTLQRIRSWWHEGVLMMSLLFPSDRRRKYTLYLLRLRWFLRALTLRLHLRYWLIVRPFQTSPGDNRQYDPE